jgi:hypothetical protein
MLSYDAFQERVEYNTAELVAEVGKKTPDFLDLMKRIYYANAEIGEVSSSADRSKYYTNAIPALFIGALPVFSPTGVDAITVNPDDTVEDIELKTTVINGRVQLCLGQSGQLMVKTGKRNSNITAYMKASYSFCSDSNIVSKKMRTVLMLQDTSDGDNYIDAYEMSGDSVINYLMSATKNNIGYNQIKHVKMPLSAFMLGGKRADTAVKLEGFHSWSARQRLALRSKRR